MNANDTLPDSSGGGTGAASDDAGDHWAAAGPATGLRVRLPIAVAALAVMALVGAAAGAALKKPSPSTAVQAGGIGANRVPGAAADGAAGHNGRAGADGAAGQFAGPRGGLFGTIAKVDGNTITLTQRDGTTATVAVSSGTTVNKTVSGSLSDLTAGTAIAVRGTTAGGKTTAESVTINPANGAGGPGFGDPSQPHTTGSETAG